MAFTCMGVPLNAQLLRQQYLVVLRKVEEGVLRVRERTVLETLMKKRHVFRGGTSLDSGENITNRRVYYTNLISECMDEQSEQISTPRTHRYVIHTSFTYQQSSSITLTSHTQETETS